jgi:hypothetical protein
MPPNPAFCRVKLASQASDVGSIPIARSIAQLSDDSIVLTPLTVLAIGRQEIIVDSTWTITALGRSRPAADASREVVERWLLDDLM